jgi:hypothetical protein
LIWSRKGARTWAHGNKQKPPFPKWEQASASHSELKVARVSHSVVFHRDSKSGRGLGSFIVGKREGFRCAQTGAVGTGKL